MRKTIEIEVIKSRINNALKGINMSNDEKMALATFLERILHDTGNYKGFILLDPKEGVPTWLDYKRQYI